MVFWRVTHVAHGGVMKAFEGLWFYSLTASIWVHRRSTILSPTPQAKAGSLLTEAALFARQLSNQLPELWETQLPVVVFVQRAHELLDDAGIAGVLRVRGRPWSQRHPPPLSCNVKKQPALRRLSCHLMVECIVTNTTELQTHLQTRLVDDESTCYCVWVYVTCTLYIGGQHLSNFNS